MSIWKQIYKHLKEKGFDVYSPGQKQNECKAPYTVVKMEGSSKHSSFSTNVAYYSILIYVPRDKYSILDETVQSVKNAMKELKPMIDQYGQEQPSSYDDSVKAHMVSVMYRNYKKI